MAVRKFEMLRATKVKMSYDRCDRWAFVFLRDRSDHMETRLKSIYVIGKFITWRGNSAL